MAEPPPPRWLVRESYSERMDDLYYHTIAHAERAFRVNVYINITLVSVGIILVANSIIYSWVKDFNVFSILFGTIGVLEFVTIFYLTPQRKIQKTVGDLTQMQMLYRTYYTQIEAVESWNYMNPEKAQGELERMNNHLQDITIKTAQKVEDFIGKKEAKQ
jgi:hypothetical protein